MNVRERFKRTMRYEPVDRAPYFEEGVRPEVLEVWKKQGLAENADLSQMFPSDPREEIFPDMEPRPKPERWPSSTSELEGFKSLLNPHDPGRLSENRDENEEWKTRDRVTMLRVHRGLFLTMGIYGWDRFAEVMRILVEDPELVHGTMALQAEFCAMLAEKVLKDVEIDAAIFSEPIGGNARPLISPKMYEDYVLKSYAPVMDVLRRHGVETIVFRTFANARILIPKILKWGFNCLWACEVDIEAMDYRSLRKEFGRDLRLIGGIDLDALRRGKDAIEREIEEKVPALLEQGGYAPLADGRVREDVPFENYVFYRESLEKAISRNNSR